MRSWHAAFFPKSWLFVIRWFWNEKTCMGETCGVFFCSADANASLQVICHPQICKCRDAWCVCAYLCACVWAGVGGWSIKDGCPFQKSLKHKQLCRTHCTYRSQLNTLTHTQLKLSHVYALIWTVMHTVMLGEHKHILCALRGGGKLIAERLCTGSKSR